MPGLNGSPRRFVALGWGVIGLFLLGFGAWGASAPLSSAIIASGVVVVETSRKVVQHLEGGNVARVLVRDGDVVERGQALIRLDPTAAESRLKRLRHQIDALWAQTSRLTAERDGRAEVDFPHELVDRAGDARVAEIVHRERELFAARKQSIEGQLDILGTRTQVLNEQISGLNAQVSAKEEQIALIRDEHAGLQKLYEKGYVPKTRLLALKRAISRLSGERGSHLSDIARTRKEIGESGMRALQLRKDFLRQVIDELNEADRQLADLQEQERAVADVLRRTTVVAPVGGTVVGLTVRAPGEVIRPGDRLLEIVPESDRLIVEAAVRPQDVDRVIAGQAAEVRLTAFNQKTVPALPAKVTYVSADRLETGAERRPYYQVKLELEHPQRETVGRLRLIPGMPAEVFIEGGSRTLLSYLAKPLTDSFMRAMREE